jgi:[ribosomal protein S18]-alanine N-acetyltransferase
VSLRPFRPDDLETLYRIDQACFPGGVSYSRQELAAFITHRTSKTWVAVASEQIIGFLVAGRAPQRLGHIITIDVAEHWRRRNVGTALMDSAEAWAHAQRLRFVYLETAEDNLTAQAFYEKRGYATLKRIPRYYANGAAACVMVKALKGIPPRFPSRSGRGTDGRIPLRPGRDG